MKTNKSFIIISTIIAIVCFYSTTFAAPIFRSNPPTYRPSPSVFKSTPTTSFSSPKTTTPIFKTPTPVPKVTTSIFKTTVPAPTGHVDSITRQYRDNQRTTPSSKQSIEQPPIKKNNPDVKPTPPMNHPRTKQYTTPYHDDFNHVVSPVIIYNTAQIPVTNRVKRLVNNAFVLNLVLCVFITALCIGAVILISKRFK